MEYTTGFFEVGLGVYKVLYYDQYYVSAVLGPLITVIAPVTQGAFLQSVREDEVVDELTTVKLNNLLSKTSEIDSKIDTLNGNIQVINESINSLSGDLQTISGNLDALAQTVNTVNSEVQAISRDVTNLKSEVDALSEDVQIIEDIVRSVE
jgi:outer membrane murein-binding lipoprotein Lpp